MAAVDSGVLRALSSDQQHPFTTLARMLPQSVAERLPAALAPADRDMLAAVGAPAADPDVSGAVVVPGSGPHPVDYSPAGADCDFNSSILVPQPLFLQSYVVLHA